MKTDLIVPGCEYVVSLKPKHILIPGTDTTYVERLGFFEAMSRDERKALPKAALAEYGRLQEACSTGLKSRISRCSHLASSRLSFIDANEGHRIEQRVGLRFTDSLGVVVRPVEHLPKQRIRIEADFIEQTGRGFEHLCARAFDATIPDPPGDAPDDIDEDDEDAWWEEHDSSLRDPAGTMQAIVHTAAFKFLLDDGLLARLDAEQQAWNAGSAEREAKLWADAREKYMDVTIDRGIDRILTDAARPADDEWEALA